MTGAGARIRGRRPVHTDPMARCVSIIPRYLIVATPHWLERAFDTVAPHAKRRPSLRPAGSALLFPQTGRNALVRRARHAGRQIRAPRVERLALASE